MSSQIEDKSGSPLDTVLLLAATLLVGGAIVAFYYFQADYNALIRTGGVVLAVAAALALIYQTALGRNAWVTIQGSRTEMRKVVWPTRQESVQTTLLIAVVVLIMALALWGLDSLLLWGVKGLTGRG